VKNGKKGFFHVNQTTPQDLLVAGKVTIGKLIGTVY
jgi:hypothetical protein